MHRIILFFIAAAVLFAPAFSQGDGSQRQLRQQAQSIKKMQKDLAGLQKERASLGDTLKAETRRLQVSVTAGLDSVASKVDRSNRVTSGISERLSEISEQRLSGMESRTRTYFSVAFLLFFAAFGFVLSRFYRITKKLDATEQLMQETLRLETKMSELLEDHQSLTDEVKKTTSIFTVHQAQSKQDHSFYIAVAEEVYRMRSRLSKMPQDTKGWVALTNALSRMENELNMKGYRITDLSGQPYHDEMTAVVKEFVPQDDVPEGEQKVLRMIRPQVKFNDTVVSHGEIEVAMSVEDLAQK